LLSKVSEVAIEARVTSYLLEKDASGIQDKVEALQDNNHLVLWDADLKSCNTREKAIACFDGFAASAVLIKDEATVNLHFQQLRGTVSITSTTKRMMNWMMKIFPWSQKLKKGE